MRKPSVWLQQVLIIVVVLACFTLAWGQQQPSDVIQQVQQAYQQLEYKKAERLVQKALVEYDRFSVEQLTELHRLLALIEISQNNQLEARRNFEAALSLNPALGLDSTLVSPKILSFFQQVKRQYLAHQGGAVTDSVAVRYYLMRDPRLEATLRSAILPGWGQLHKGEQLKGKVLMGIWGGAMTGAFAAQLLHASGQEDWQGVRNSFLGLAASSWVFSYLDALLRPPSSSVTRQVQVRPTWQPKTYAGLQVRISF